MLRKRHSNTSTWTCKSQTGGRAGVLIGPDDKQLYPVKARCRRANTVHQNIGDTRSAIIRTNGSMKHVTDRPSLPTRHGGTWWETTRSRKAAWCTRDSPGHFWPFPDVLLLLDHAILTTARSPETQCRTEKPDAGRDSSGPAGERGSGGTVGRRRVPR